MACCSKCGAEEPMLSDGLCAACEPVFGTPSARRFRSRLRQFDLGYSAYALAGLYGLLESAWMAGHSGQSTGLVLLFFFGLLFIALAAIVRHRLTPRSFFGLSDIGLAPVTNGVQSTDDGFNWGPSVLSRRAS